MENRHERKLIEQMNLYYDACAIGHDYYMNYISFAAYTVHSRY